MAVSVSLREALSWESACLILEIPLPDRALPVRTRCPLCHKLSLDIYNDNTTTGQWHHCDHCGATGDMLELVRAAWGMSLDAAIKRLIAAGLLQADIDLGTIVTHEQQTSRQHAVLDLWKSARSYYPTCQSHEIAMLRDEFGLQMNVSHDRWMKGPGILLGALPCAGIEETWRKLGGSKIFKGKGWTEALITPYFDMPGRIKAFAFLGRDINREKDELFKLSPSARGTSTEAGLAGIEILSSVEPCPEVIGVDDHMLMMHLQARTLRNSLNPLPMVAWKDDGHFRTSSAWGMVGNRRVILWSMELDARVVRQAAECDAMISLAGPQQLTAHAINHYFRLHPGASILRIIRRKARPWPEAVGIWLAASTEGQRETLWTALERSGADVSYILRKLGQAAPLSLLRRQPSVLRRSVTFNNRVIVEEGDRWYVTTARSRRQIANASLRLTHAIKDRQSGEMFYRGDIGFNGQQIPFIAPIGMVRKNTVKWLDQKLIEASAGILLVENDFKKKLHDIAVSFREPEFVIDDLYRWVRRLPTTI